jgi:hypothetical protein
MGVRRAIAYIGNGNSARIGSVSKRVTAILRKAGEDVVLQAMTKSTCGDGVSQCHCHRNVIWSADRGILGVNIVDYTRTHISWILVGVWGVKEGHWERSST